MTATWFDSHCHLQEQFLEGDRDATQELAAALARASQAGVSGLVVIGTDEQTSRQAIALAEASASGALGSGVPSIAATVGLHPHDALTGTEWLGELIDEHRASISGIGECGLDYFYEHSPRHIQRKVFLEQVALAKEHDLALVIHARDAWDDLFGALDEVGPPARTILHCFTGGSADAQACVDRGIYVSFSGIVTFKNATETREALGVVPDHLLLIETDAPFLAPVPHRGRKNEPAWVAVVGAYVATERGADEVRTADLTMANAKAAFALR